MDEFALELVRDWMTRASHDLRAAHLLAAADDPPLDAAIYHCQQAAEKSVKAWLQGQDEPFRKTHDVAELVKQASESNPHFAQLDTAAAVVTPYATAIRYPGGTYEPMPTREEFHEARQHAQTIYEFVINQLPEKARPRGDWHRET